MKFNRELANKVLRGEKTQTRRPVEGPCKYKVGRSYKLRSDKPINQLVKVGAVRKERLGAISEMDVLSEGFKSVEEFFTCWEEIYGAVDKSCLVYVIDFCVDDSPRLLHKNSAHGYTHLEAMALPGEPEAIDERSLELLVQEGRQRDEARRAYFAMELWKSEQEAISRLRALAKKNHVDVTGDLRLIEKKTKKMIRKLAKAA